MQKFNADQLLDLLSARMAHGMYVDGEGAICTDTRRLCEGDWFLALCGENFDGHDFLGDAYSAGAIGAIVEERLQYSLGNKTFPLLAVDNTFNALALLARQIKSSATLPVVAIRTQGERDEINRLFDFARNELDERGIGSVIYTQTSSSRCLDTFINLNEETLLIFNLISDRSDPDMARDWEIVLNTLSPEIMIECKNSFAPDFSADTDANLIDDCRPYRVQTDSQKTHVDGEIKKSAEKWQLDPAYVGAIIEALDHEFPKLSKR